MEIFQGIGPQALEYLHINPDNLKNSFLHNIARYATEKATDWTGTTGTVGFNIRENRSVSILGTTIDLGTIRAIDFPTAFAASWKENAETLFPDENFRKLADLAIKTFLGAYGKHALEKNYFEDAANALDPITDGGFTKNEAFATRIQSLGKHSEATGNVLLAFRLAGLINTGLNQQERLCL